MDEAEIPGNSLPSHDWKVNPSPFLSLPGLVLGHFPLTSLTNHLNWMGRRTLPAFLIEWEPEGQVELFAQDSFKPKERTTYPKRLAGVTSGKPCSAMRPTALTAPSTSTPSNVREGPGGDELPEVAKPSTSRALDTDSQTCGFRHLPFFPHKFKDYHSAVFVRGMVKEHSEDLNLKNVLQ